MGRTPSGRESKSTAHYMLRYHAVRFITIFHVCASACCAILLCSVIYLTYSKLDILIHNHSFLTRNIFLSHYKCIVNRVTYTLAGLVNLGVLLTLIIIYFCIQPCHRIRIDLIRRDYDLQVTRIVNYFS